MTAVITCEAGRIADTEHGRVLQRMEAAVHLVLGLASVKNGHLVKQLLLLPPVTILILPDQCDTSNHHIDQQEATIPGGLEVGHGQAIIDLSLEPGRVGGAKEVQSFDIQLCGEKMREVEAGGGLANVHTLW